MVKEVAKQETDKITEQTAEHRANVIFFVCAASSCGALFSSCAAFYEGEYRKMRSLIISLFLSPSPGFKVVKTIANYLFAHKLDCEKWRASSSITLERLHRCPLESL